MLKQIRLLSGVQLINLLGINEARYTKDSGKRKRFLGMAVVWSLLAVTLLGYVCALAYGLVQIGMADTIPAYLYTVVSLIILVFTFFKAGSVIFQKNSYEMLVSLPVSGTAVVISRFLTMYVTDLLFALLILLPGLGMYAAAKHPAFSFYLYGLLGTLALPLLPITLATVAGAVIMAVSSRFRHKSIAASMLTLLFAVSVVAASLLFSGKGEQQQFDQELLRNLAEVIRGQLKRFYPPAGWFSGAVVEQSAADFLLLWGSSAFVFGGMAAVLQKYFYRICSALNASYARQNYKMQKLGQSSAGRALWKKELRRYFASSIYVTNTMMGYLLMPLAAAAVFFAGVEKTEQLLELPGILSRTFPLLLGFMAGMMPTTACALSMEGKQLWIVQTLPVSTRALAESKILVNLTVGLPFYFIAMLFALPAAKLSIIEGICFAFTPVAYLLFSAVSGMLVNLHFPIFNWESEVRVVKQSASVMIVLLIGFFDTLVPMALVFIWKEIPAMWIWAGTDAVLFTLAWAGYRKLCQNSTIKC